MRSNAQAAMALCLAACFALCAPVSMGWAAAPAGAQEGSGREAAAPGRETPDAALRAPVPVPEPSEKALSYYNSGSVLWVVSVAWSMLVPALFLFTGLSARLRDRARAIGRGWFFTVALYSVFFTLLTFLLDLPLAYAGYVRHHAYGLSNQTLGKWLEDTGKGLAVGIVLGALTLWLPYLLLRKSPRRWWLYTGVVAVPFTAVMLLVTPIWIDPLFNDFGPMKDKALEADILALAERAGIEGSRVYEVDKSVDTKTVNAYVTGLAGTKRIVLWDTILQKLDRSEILSVMGHEMGHYVLGHVRQAIVVAAALILLGLWVVHRSADALIRCYRDRFGFGELADVASLPLILLLFNLTLFVLSPAVLAFSRHNEHEADRFGLELTRDNRAAALAFVKLQEENLAIPRPSLLYKLWRASHPLLGERIDFANSYRPWETGEPLAYGDRMGR